MEWCIGLSLKKTCQQYFNASAEHSRSIYHSRSGLALTEMLEKGRPEKGQLGVQLAFPTFIYTLPIWAIEPYNSYDPIYGMASSHWQQPKVRCMQESLKNLHSLAIASSVMQRLMHHVPLMFTPACKKSLRHGNKEVFKSFELLKITPRRNSFLTWSSNKHVTFLMLTLVCIRKCDTPSHILWIQQLRKLE